MSKPANPLWKTNDGRKIRLLRGDELSSVPNGTRLLCINGTYAVKGVDIIDTDTRAGYLAYGFEERGE